MSYRLRSSLVAHGCQVASIVPVKQFVAVRLEYGQQVKTIQAFVFAEISK